MEYRLIKTADELSPYLSALLAAKVVGIDTETTGLDPHGDKLRLVQLAIPAHPVLVLDCFAFLPDGLAMLKEIFASPAVKVFHNAKFDLQFLMGHGIAAMPVFDTMLSAQLLRSSGGSARANLAAVAAHYLDEEVDKGEQKSNWGEALSESQIAYAAKDAAVLLRLRDAMMPQLYANGLAQIAKIEFACVQAMAQMEYSGIALDQTRWEQLTEETQQLQNDALEKLYAYSGRPTYQLTLWGEEIPLEKGNFESNPYVLQLLRQNGVDVPSTDKRHLAPFAAHPLVQALSDYRRSAKALSSFLYPMPAMVNPVTGRLHPKYGQIGAWSGRMSCGGPNIQQIPREQAFRRCFCAPPGRKLIIADYSQIELRVAAQISGDRRMTEAYRRGEDLHRLTAALVSDVAAEQVTKSQRQAAKAVNFGLIFGMGAAGLQQYAQQSYGVEMTLEQAESFRNSFFKAYTGIAAWHKDVRNAKPTEERSLSGRRFMFGANAGASGLYNTPVQGTAADITKAALGLLAKKLLGTDIKIIAVVHDEILLEAAAENAEQTAVLLQLAMEQAGNKILRDIPCVAEATIADDWAGK